eukprot:3177848-Rhodomonas_salina.8
MVVPGCCEGSTTRRCWLRRSGRGRGRRGSARERSRYGPQPYRPTPVVGHVRYSDSLCRYISAMGGPVLTYRMMVSAYARGTRCPVLTQGVALSAYARALRCPVLT